VSVQERRLEAEIAQTRHQLGETVEALAEKADVKSKAAAKVDAAKTAVRRRPVPFAAAAFVLLSTLVVRRVAKRRRRRRAAG
jgi:hypothetical protein